MALFGSDWKETEEERDKDHGGMMHRHWLDEDDRPIRGDNWVIVGEDPNAIPMPSVYQLLDQMTNEERLKVFNHYCKQCGSKDKVSCGCW